MVRSNSFGVDLKELIERGTIISVVDFLDVYDELNARKENYEYQETYQPSGCLYGSRFHAHPCYETEKLEIVDLEMNNIIRSKVENLFSQKIIDWKCFVRLSLSSEVKESNSMTNSNYSFVHKDPESFAGVLPFEQSPTGGTAFFEYHWDKVPDITHGSYPNRLILYNGHRWHAAGQDFNFEKRYVLGIFFNLA
jgi:hypothetical protein